MRKTLFLITVLLGTFIVPAQAAPTQAVAIIDTGVNSSLFSNIVTEVCILESLTCANGKKFMEGPKAANVGVTNNLAVNHGNAMASIVTKVNPNVGIIPIKIAATTAQGKTRTDAHQRQHQWRNDFGRQIATAFTVTTTQAGYRTDRTGWQ